MGIVQAAGHVTRYAVGAAASWLLFPLEAIACYLLLLLYAVLFDEPTGGPLGLPVLVLVVATVGLAATVLVTTPAVAIGEWAGRRLRWYAAPVASVAVTAAVAVIGCAALALLIVAFLGDGSPNEFLVIWTVVGALVALPLSAQFAITQGAAGALRLLGRLGWLGRFTARRAAGRSSR